MTPRFSDIEKQDLLKAWLAISLVFAFSSLKGTANPKDFPLLLIMSGLSVGIAFLVHELAHKFVAQRYGMWAEFRAEDTMLLFSLALVFISPIVFVLPGAVMIAGYGSQEQEGKISLSGPAINIFVALLSYAGLLALISLSLPALPTLTVPLLNEIYRINAWLAFFNLLPFGILDGAKIKRWNPNIWLIAIVAAGYLTFILPR